MDGGWLQHQCRKMIERNMDYERSKYSDKYAGGSGAPRKSEPMRKEEENENVVCLSQLLGCLRR